MNQSKVYILVIEHIKMLVKKGEITIGGKLPSERQLMATLKMSRNSIREALRSLEIWASSRAVTDRGLFS